MSDQIEDNGGLVFTTEEELEVAARIIPRFQFW